MGKPNDTTPPEGVEFPEIANAEDAKIISVTGAKGRNIVQIDVDSQVAASLIMNKKQWGSSHLIIVGNQSALEGDEEGADEVPDGERLPLGEEDGIPEGDIGESPKSKKPKKAKEKKVKKK